MYLNLNSLIKIGAYYLVRRLNIYIIRRLIDNMENTNPREERARKLLENPNTHKRNRASLMNLDWK
jgi:hypothetical protein